MREISVYPSGNFNRRYAPIDMIVLHYTGMKTDQEALDRMCNRVYNVSAHYFIFENGDIYNLVDEQYRAWHAGLSSWKGVTDINSRSIGIEISNPGHEFGYRPFNAAQISSLTDLCQDIIKRYHIPPENILGHSDVAPTRKQDPGELFPWKTLAKNGIGLWTDNFICSGDLSADEMLCAIGYDTSREEAAITAFQRHFYPEALTANAPNTLKRLRAVHEIYCKKGNKNETL